MNNTANTECVRCIIFGRVQGIFFRASTQNQAQRLGIVGYAKNLSDGSVEVVACGPIQELDELKQWLHEGPTGSQVIKVECEAMQGQNFTNFRTF